MLNNAQIIVYSCVALVGAIVLASIFSNRFRKDFLASDGETKVFGLLSVTGAALVILCALLIGGAILAARMDYDLSVALQSRDLTDCRSNLRQRDAQIATSRSEIDRQESLIKELRNRFTKEANTMSPRLVFKTSANSDRPFCDSAGSPLPERVPQRENSGLYNLALLIESSASASSSINDPTGSRHRINYLNDGWYNNCRSWIPAIMPAWAQIDLSNDYEISAVAFGSEHDAYYKDRATVSFVIKVASQNAPQSWTTVFSSADKTPVRSTTRFAFSPIIARYIRVEILESIGGDVRIDELEVYGKSNT